MEIVKKWGIAILCVVALIALFLPMATIETTTDYEFLDSSTSISGFTVAFQGYVCLVLIVGPVVILEADYIELAKKIKAVVTLRKKFTQLLFYLVVIFLFNNPNTYTESFSVKHIFFSLFL